MWIKFDKLQQEVRTSARTGKDYDAYVLYGIKKGGDWGEDKPYSRMFFESSTTAITGRDGNTYADANIVDFIKSEVNSGDTLELKMKKNPGAGPRAFDVVALRFVNKPDGNSGRSNPVGPSEDGNPYASSVPTPPWITK